jgi:endonuclease YncB( thermonuclease family)
MAGPKYTAYQYPILRVIDGDTVVVGVDLPPPLKSELAVRIYGVDTPEKGPRAQCEEEDRLGKLATEFTKDRVARATTHEIRLMRWDKFGGRVLGDIILDHESLRGLLIANQYAHEYYGAKKTSWCK